MGAGHGVVAPYVAARRARYTGIDASPLLIEIARHRHGRSGRFVVGDARSLNAARELRLHGYDAAVFLLSIQDMDPLEPIVASLDWTLSPFRGRCATRPGAALGRIDVVAHRCWATPTA